jgi:cytochrome c-type biogenesis protein CcmH/NrfF
LMLWGMPVLLLLIGGAMIYRQASRRRLSPAVAPLSASEEKQLRDILDRREDR